MLHRCYICQITPFHNSRKPKISSFCCRFVTFRKNKKHLILFSPYNINIITNFACKSIESFNFFTSTRNILKSAPATSSCQDSATSWLPILHIHISTRRPLQVPTFHCNTTLARNCSWHGENYPRVPSGNMPTISTSIWTTSATTPLTTCSTRL